MTETGKNLIFLISQPRAGSTLTQRILGSHSQIHTISEPWLMLHPLYAFRKQGYQAEYESHWAFEGLKNTLNLLPDGTNVYLAGIRKMYSHIYNSLLETTSKKYFLDKTPRYYHIIPELYATFPDAKYIILLRNPLAVFSSMLHTWIYPNPRNNDELLREKLLDLLKAPKLLLESINRLGDKVYVLHYEELLQNPETELQNLLEFLNLKFEVDIINYGDVVNKDSSATNWFMGDKEKINIETKPDINNIDNWINKLENPNTWQLVNDYLQFLGEEIIEAMGYNYSFLNQIIKEKQPINLKATISLSQVFPKIQLFTKWKNESSINLSKQIPTREYLISNVQNKQPLPKISIVTPSFNQGEFLEECITSVLNQGYPNLEYIIMDGGSTDNSVEIIKKYEKYLTYWQSKSDGGHYNAVNQAFRDYSTGEIMAWINSDDKYHPDAFYKVVSAFKQNSQADWIMGLPTIWNKDGYLVKILYDVPSWSREFILGKEYIGKVWIQQESCFWRRSLWEKAGSTLNTKFDLAADFELWVRFSRHAQLFIVNSLIAGFRHHGKQQRSKMYLNRYIQQMNRIIADEDILTQQEDYIDLIPTPLRLTVNDTDIWNIKQANFKMAIDPVFL